MEVRSSSPPLGGSHDRLNSYQNVRRQAVAKRKRLEAVIKEYGLDIPDHWPDEQKELAIKEFKIRHRKHKIEETKRLISINKNAKAAKNVPNIMTFFSKKSEVKDSKREV